MKLNAYLKLHKITYRDFAVRVGESASSINRFANGRRMPSLRVAARISEATNGTVSFVDFLDMSPTNGRTSSVEVRV